MTSPPRFDDQTSTATAGLETDSIRDQFSSFPGMRVLLDQVEKARASRHGVLIAGEPGSGRELVARAIHGDDRASGPFVTVDCGSNSPEHVEREMFGNQYRRQPSQSGVLLCDLVLPGSLLYLARGGTMVFRHIEELSERVQTRLARLLRDGEATFGDGQADPLDVRPVALVEPDADRMVADGHVRPALFRRFSATTIHVPPLRERREDIPILAIRFLEEACRAARIPAKTLTPPVLSLLAALPWYGNARELRNLIDLLVVKEPHDEVSINTLLAELQLSSAGTGPARVGLKNTLREARSYFEREYIAAVLALHHGRISDSARALGIQRTNLYRKLRSLHLTRPRGSEAQPAGHR